MPNTEKIDELISEKALQGFDLLNEKLNISVANLEKMIATGVDLNKAFGANDSFKKTNDGAAKLTEVEGQLEKMTRDLAVANAKLLASYSDQAQQIANVKVQQQAVNKANTDAAKDTLGLVGAYDRLNKEYQDAAKNAKNLAAQYGADAQQVKEAANAANALQTRLKAIDASVGVFNRNVGNYAGSLGGAFAVLQKELQTVQSQLKTTDSGSSAFAGLAKQEQLLTSLTENLNKGFSSTKQELRAYQEAAKQLGLEVGLTSKTFIEFTDKVGDTKNELDDIQKTLNLKASDTKFLDGAIAAVNGLAGVYGAAQGAAALLGDEEGDLQKQFVKLQAIMTIIQSLQAVQNALQTESGAIQLALAGKTALLNAALVVENALFKINTAVVAENAAAQEADALATTGAATALEGEAVAATTATAATTAFKTALIATGIGAIIVAIAAAVVYLVSKIPAWLQGNALTIKQQQALADSVSKANEVLIAQGAVIEDQNQQAQRFFTSQLTLSQAAGQNQYKQLALQKQLAQLQKEQAKEEIDRLGATNKAYADNGAAYRTANNKKMEALDQLIELQKIPSKQLTSDQQRQIDGLNTLIDLYDKQGSAAKALYDAQGKARQDLITANIAADKTEIDTAKLSADERRKLILTEAGLEVAAVTNKNSLILSNDASTLAQRLKAMESNAAAQRRLQQAQTADVKNNPSSTQNDVVIAERQQAEKVREINENLQKELLDLRTEYAIRDRLAGLAQLKLQLDDVAKTNDLIVENEKKTFDQKTSAAYLALKARLAILKQETDEELRNVKLTDEERRAITAKNASEAADLTVQYGLKQIALYKANEALITAAIEKEAKKRADVVSKENSDAIAGLNGQLISGNMNFGKYAKERADIEADNNIKAAQDAEKTEQAKTAATKAGTAERAAAEAELAKKQIALQDAIIAKEKLKQQEFIADLEKIKMYADTVLDLIGGILDASITAQKNALQDQSDAVSEANQKEIDAINASADTEEKKAARIAIVNARAQAQKEAIDRKQRQLDIQKAQFDKAKAIVDIILNTAIAVSKALYEGGPFLAAVYAAIGAAQLAVAIATPIPKFATGTADAPGGLAMVGDGGRSEMIVTPDGRLISTPDTPTVMNVPQHSVIFPDAEEFRNIGNGGRVPTITESQAYYKDITNVLGGKIDTLINTVKNKQEIHLLPRKDGWEKIKKGRNGSQTNYINKV